MWSGIYKITWQNLASLKSWVEMCNETVMQQLKGVEEYKSVNKAINAILAEVRKLKTNNSTTSTRKPRTLRSCSSPLLYAKSSFSFHTQIEERRIPFLDVEEGDPDKFLAFSSSLVRKHIGFCVQKTKSLTNYVLKLESFLEVKSQSYVVLAATNQFNVH